MALAAFIPLLLLLSLSAAAPAAPAALDSRLSTSVYAPKKATCPSGLLVRKASSISSSEASYIAARKPVADTALAAWLSRINSKCNTASLPAVGLTTSGGGFRSMLTGAGVIQALDSRDGKHTTSGLFQGLTYEAGLSGGAWLLSSFAGNGWPTISALLSTIWDKTLPESIFLSDFSITDPTLLLIANDIIAKDAAGFEPVIDDVWGRLLSDTLLNGTDGGVSDTLSGLANSANFSAHDVPFPLITSIDVADPYSSTTCLPPANATQWEFNPFEFGSWDVGVDAFTPTHYLGTSVSHGKAQGSCYTGYDNLGYVLGSSSNLFNEECSVTTPSGDTSIPSVLVDLLEDVLGSVSLSNRAEYAVYPNPFEKSPVAGTAADISSATELYLVDGGETGQNDPIWPFLQPARSVDVLIVNDNSADTSDNWPNGTEIYQTYLRAQQAGLAKMPTIPPVSTFAANLTTPRFFGCNQTQAITIVYLPNAHFSYPSNTSTLQLEYSASEANAMVANGALVATQNGDANWPTCLACAIMSSSLAASGTTIDECTSCFSRYCYS